MRIGKTAREPITHATCTTSLTPRNHFTQHMQCTFHAGAKLAHLCHFTARASGSIFRNSKNPPGIRATTHFRALPFSLNLSNVRFTRARYSRIFVISLLWLLDPFFETRNANLESEPPLISARYHFHSTHRIYVSRERETRASLSFHCFCLRVHF